MVLDLACNNLLQGYSEKVVQMISREFPTVDLLRDEIKIDLIFATVSDIKKLKLMNFYLLFLVFT